MFCKYVLPEQSKYVTKQERMYNNILGSWIDGVYEKNCRATRLDGWIGYGVAIQILSLSLGLLMESHMPYRRVTMRRRIFPSPARPT